MNDSSPNDSDVPVVPYQTPSPRPSNLALTALILSILGALTFVLVVPSLIALIVALFADHRIQQHPDRLSGRGTTVFAIILSSCMLGLALLTALILPSLARTHSGAGRSYCAANLRGIASAMVIYSATNSDQYPIVTYAPYSPALNSPTASASFSNPIDTINSYYKAPYPQAGSVTANLWRLTLDGMSPKLFICKNYEGKMDPYVTGPADTQDSRKNFFDNFQNDKQLSYSAAYPWKADGTVGKWWSNTADASIPLMSDMAPEQDTGTPKRVLNPTTYSGPKTWNSSNHAGDYQNVVFADCHVDFAIRPNVGQNGDNIWTTSGTPSKGPSEFGIPATKSSPALTRDEPPYDIIMYPIRNLDTGRL